MEQERRDEGAFVCTLFSLCFLLAIEKLMEINDAETWLRSALIEFVTACEVFYAKLLHFLIIDEKSRC